jgi:hypothetical protein
MALLENTAAMIDHMMVRFRLNDAGGRIKCLEWLQRAENNLWTMADWWFKYTDGQFVTHSGTAVYTLAAPCLAVADLRLSERALDFLEQSVFQRVLAPHATMDVPQVWTELPLDVTTQTPRVRLWPIPNAALTVDYTMKRRSNELADHASSVSAVPEQYRMVLIGLAEQYMAQAEGQTEAVGQLHGYNQQLIAAMAAEDERHVKAFRR